MTVTPIPSRIKLRAGLTSVLVAASSLTILIASPAGAAGTARVSGSPSSTSSAPSSSAAPQDATASSSGTDSSSPGLATAPQPRTGTPIAGEGSSFAGPEVLGWTADTAKSPYNIRVDYTSSSSGSGRFNFGNGTIDFAVSDIPYQPAGFDNKQPSFPFMYVPVTAGGLAFMYHLNALPRSTKLQLSSRTICGIMTGGIQSWNDPNVAHDNPGVSLPAIPVHPVIRRDLAGTNFVLQEYCIHEQPALWRAFVTSPAVVQAPGQVTDLSPTDPRSDWPLFSNSIQVDGSANAADNVSSPNNDGYITAVEFAYALQRGYPAASVLNASGKYAQPNPDNVASALAYATQNADGTHVLNFDGVGPNVYNPSTYSYLLTPTTGWSAAKGNTLSQFANYALTIGQQKAKLIGYASLGLSLEQYGVKAIQQKVPGAAALTALEQNAFQCGDLTVADVQAGKTQPTCGVLNSNNSTTPGQAAAGGGGSSRTSGAGSGAGAGGGAGGGAGSGSGANGGAGSGSGAGINPGVSLSGTPSLAYTGGSPLLIVAAGVTFVFTGWAVRRRLRARMR